MNYYVDELAEQTLKKRKGNKSFKESFQVCCLKMLNFFLIVNQKTLVFCQECDY